MKDLLSVLRLCSDLRVHALTPNRFGQRVDEPDTSYHPIGTLASRGGPNVPASYEFPVTTGMVVGESYCFRLREITTDNTVGEMPTLCGYGPNVTPTPGAPGVPGALVPG